MYELQSVVAWAKTKNPETEYDPDHPRHCLLATYLKELGVGFLHVKLDGGVVDFNGHAGTFEFESNAAALYNTPIQMEPHTYGAFVARAEAMLAVN